MKNSKRFLAMMTAGFLAITPMAATGLTAFAVNSSTLTVVDSDTVNHTYNAYQILTGNTDGGKLTSLSMGNGISQADLITAINATSGSGTLASTATLDEIATALANITSDSDTAATLAKEIAKHKVTANAKTLTRGSGSDNYTNTSLANGWYLILDETNPLASSSSTTNTQVRSANILELTQDSTINTKHSLPTLDKVIVEGGTEKVANSAAIGDTITYNIKLNVPDVRGYDKYYYVVEDTLSSGLTYNEDLAVTVASVAADEDTDGPSSDTDTGDFYVTQSGTSIKVVFENAVNNFKDKTVGAPIVISYTATLNSNAVIGNAGNPNTAKLVYSNDPNATGTGTNETGKPDEPSSSAPTGETPNETVTTYSTAIKVNKVDQNNNALKGAVFTLSSSDFNEVKVVSGYTFEEDNTNGTYYKLADGSYTKTAPVGDAVANPTYDATDFEKKYKKVYISSGTNDTIIEKSNATSYSIEAQVDENGVITFNGLKPGTYTLSEKVTPEGYNTASPVEITITATNSSGVLQAPSNWTVSGASYVAEDNAFSLNVVNKQGATLPTTGGIGTKLFYIIGGLLVAGSVVLLVTKKRMKTNED